MEETLLYRVLLVDDEEEIRTGISRKIQWEKQGFVLVGEAANGHQAMELAETLCPDVVLTDIKMPFMDGLELCRWLQKSLPATKVVMFSGFDEFEYARQAVAMNVFEYILKPINSTELTQVLCRLKEKMDCKRAEQRDLEVLRHRYEESLPLLCGLFYTRLLDGQIPAAQVHERAAQYELQLPEGAWITALFRADHLSDTLNRDELLLSIQAFIENHKAELPWTLHTALYKDDVAVMIHTNQVYLLLENLERLRNLAQSELGLAITVGAGIPVEQLADLHQSCTGAQAALEYRVIMGGQRVIYIGDLEPDMADSVTWEEDDQYQLVSAIKLGEKDDVACVVRRLIGRIRKKRIDLAQGQLFLMEYTTHLIRLARTNGIELEQVFGSEFTGKVPIDRFDSYEDLESWCVEKGLQLRELLGQQRTDCAGQMMERAKDFIQKNYADSTLSVETLCSYLHLSAAYFSTVFKRETGMSFTSYVTGVRMEQAVRLLKETDDKTYMIAEKVGYTDANYFSYVFKRKYSVSPSKYRAGEGVK